MSISPFLFQRPQGEFRRGILRIALFLGLLAPLSFVGAQTAPATAPVARFTGSMEPQPDLADFSAWAVKFVKTQSIAGAASGPDAATLADGMRLVERRRLVLAALMQTNPARALAAGIPATLRAKLPVSVQDRLESPFSTVGDYLVEASSGHRAITINGRTYAAHVSGQQLASVSQTGVALRGFTLDDEAVLDAREASVLPGGHVASVARANPAATGSQTSLGPLPQTLYGNDPFGGALQLFDNSGSISDDNIGATKEPGEPNHAGSIGGASVWYVWTPTQSGRATFVTDDGASGLVVDTLLAVYTGTDVANLFTIVSNDDAIGFNSEVNFYATAGTTYYIAVDGYRYSSGPSEGSYTLTYFQQGNPLSPTITSDTAAVLQVNAFFSYTITATNNPTTFTASGLPFGLNFNAATGEISGSVRDLGSYLVLISASNAQGTGTSRVALTVTDQPVHFPFFFTEVALPQSPGVYYLHLPRGGIFGFYAYLDDENYIYHYDLGYEYTFNAADGKSGIYLYDFASDTFFYTSPTFPFPYLYDFKLNAVLYYYPDLYRDGRFNTNGIRYFYDFSSGNIISK